MMGNENHSGFAHATEEAYDIRIARDGSWWHEGRRVDRPGLVRLFATVLQRDDHGDFWLVTPAERGRVVVEDAPFVAVEMKVDGNGENQSVSFRTNLDDWVTAGPAHPLRARGGRLYVVVRDRLEALLNRAVYYEAVELAGAGLCLQSQGVAFALDANP